MGQLPFAPGRAGAAALADSLLHAPPAAQKTLSRAMRPTLADCALLFGPELGRSVYRYERRLSRMADIVVHAMLEDQTELLFWSARREELIANTGEACYFPGGYRELAPYLPPGTEIYRFKYVQPGRQVGSAYDMLVHVNGAWRLIHRPWTVLVGSGAR
ncbi:MAG: hypothetical protein NW241_22075 [Bacteroidia bacterium]|nr:hypothetical protein [Bacteroidia bacterium]